MSLTEFSINTRKMRYTGDALAALKKSRVDVKLRPHDKCEDSTLSVKGGDDKKGACQTVPGRVWLKGGMGSRPPQPAKGRHIGTYALTTSVAPWVASALGGYKPASEVLELVAPFAANFHGVLERERSISTGLHDLDAIEWTYQSTLEVGAAIILAADATDDPVDLSLQLHGSQAAGDDHFSSWGKLLTGLDCDPPIIVQFPFYLLMCQSFTFEPTCHREDYVYSAMTGIDWAKGQNAFNDRLASFEALARASVPTLDDISTGEDRCFWRIALAYIRAMNDCENARPFKAPRKAQIEHGLDFDLIIAARALDTIGSAYMCRDGAAWLDDQGVDSLTGSGLANDVMDLHTDIFTGETRNLLRLLYSPPGPGGIERAMRTMSTVLSSMLCEIFRGHHRARLGNREDGRVSSTSPPYSFCRARHRRIFETLELYINRYPQFWEWTWEIHRLAQTQVTDSGVSEPLVCGLKRAGTQAPLPESPRNEFFQLWYDMVEDGSTQLARKKPLGVSEDLAPVIRSLHSLWHGKLRDAEKASGWGREFDRKSDALFGEAGTILSRKGGLSEDAYNFAIAYGRLSMGLPYIAYHTVDAIIMTFGAIPQNLE